MPTGAFNPGATAGGTGLGALAGREVAVSERGLALVEKHLAQFDSFAPNAQMIARLREALRQGKKLTGADAVFYLHELNEATMMARGIEYEIAHQLALNRYGVSPFSVYHPDVISQFASHFNANWFAFWGLVP